MSQTLEQAIQQAYRNGYQKHLIRYERFGERQTALARSQAVWEVCSGFKKGDYGIGTIGEMCERFCQFIKPYQLPYLGAKNKWTLYKKLRAMNGGVIMPPRLGNQNAAGKRKKCKAIISKDREIHGKG